MCYANYFFLKFEILLGRKEKKNKIPNAEMKAFKLPSQTNTFLSRYEHDSTRIWLPVVRKKYVSCMPPNFVKTATYCREDIVYQA